MPIYEYRCQDCRKVTSFLILSLNEPFEPECHACGSRAMKRILSRVNVRLSEETRLERLADPATFAGVDENDHKTWAKALKKMGQEIGEEFPGEIDQMVEEAQESLAAGGADDDAEPTKPE